MLTQSAQPPGKGGTDGGVGGAGGAEGVENFGSFGNCTDSQIITAACGAAFARGILYPMGMPAARVTDMHLCPMVNPGLPPIPHVGGPILPPCSIDVLIGELPAARVTDMAVCVGPPDQIVLGSFTVLINDLPAARVLDLTEHGGTIMMGEFTVLVGP